MTKSGKLTEWPNPDKFTRLTLMMAKSAEGGEQRGFDGGKKVSGRKRNLIVDTQGLLVLAKVTAANVQDVHAGKQVFQQALRLF